MMIVKSIASVTKLSRAWLLYSRIRLGKARDLILISLAESRSRHWSGIHPAAYSASADKERKALADRRW